jgi:hypothetical protein
LPFTEHGLENADSNMSGKKSPVRWRRMNRHRLVFSLDFLPSPPYSIFSQASFALSSGQLRLDAFCKNFLSDMLIFVLNPYEASLHH